MSTPAIVAIQSAMQARHANLAPLYDSGAIGLTRDGKVALRDASSVPLPQRGALNGLLASENADRTSLYRAERTGIRNGSGAGERASRRAKAGVPRPQWRLEPKVKPGGFDIETIPECLLEFESSMAYNGGLEPSSHSSYTVHLAAVISSSSSPANRLPFHCAFRDEQQFKVFSLSNATKRRSSSAFSIDLIFVLRSFRGTAVASICPCCLSWPGA